MSQKTTVRKKAADKKTEAYENALNKTTDMLQEAINKVGKTSYQLNNPSTTTEFNPMEAIMKNGSSSNNPFGDMNMTSLITEPPTTEDKLKNNPFSKIFAPENAGSIADILSSLSKMFSKKATNSGSLKLSGMLNGSYIEMELTDKFTMMLARQIINKMITDVGKQV